jgi:hypothetical protein
MPRTVTLLCFCLAVIMLSLPAQAQESPRWSRDPSAMNVGAVGNPQSLPTANPNYVPSRTTPRVVYTPFERLVLEPNIRVHPSTIVWQSEVPITRHPTNQNIMYASSNAVRFSPTFISEGMYLTTDGGATWFGSDTTNAAPITGHSGDPAPVIDKDGRLIITYLGGSTGMQASYSTDMGATWAPSVSMAGGSSSDKNFSTSDDAPTSPYYGRIYNVWTNFAGTYSNRIVMSYSTNGGASWSTAAPVSPPTSSGHHHQGCDIRVGPNGEVYVVWANCTTNGQNSTEDSLGFAKSTDGGVTWAVAQNNVLDMNGIRTSNLLNGIRASGFPRIDVDRSGGSRNGWIYVTAPEKTIAPARDAGDIMLMRSTDGGATWTKSLVNSDPAGKIQYMSAIRVDENGGVNIVYYDQRNTTADSASVWVSRSIDGGNTWTDFQVMDGNFRPTPISGLAGGYQGDYIGITSGNAKIFPYWADNRTGIYQAWIAAVTIADPIDPSPPTNVSAFSDFSTPTSMRLQWTRPTTLINGTPIPPFVMRIKRNGVQITERPSTDTTFTDTGLTDGVQYTYTFTTRLIANDSLSPDVNTSWVAGGSRTPASPTNLAVTGTSAAGYKLKWTNPSRQIDGTRLDDFAGIRVYRDSVLIATLTRSSADTARVDSTTNLPPPGFHTYHLTAIDNETPINQSAPSNIAGTPLDLPMNDQFAAAGAPNPNLWASTGVDINDFGLNEPSAPYSLNLNGSPVSNSDNIESRPIDLAGRQGAGIAISYLYQPGGTGDRPEVTDSLFLDFRNSLGIWITARAYPGITTTVPIPEYAFDAVGIDGVSPQGGTFFYNGFKFRFRSRGTAGTADDDWFVDDVFFGIPTGVANIGASGVIAPSGQVSNNVALNPVIRVRNVSAVQAGVYTVHVNITGPGTAYNGSQVDSNLAAGALRNVTLSSLFTPNAVGEWTVRAWTRLTGDPNTNNDTTTATFFSVNPLSLPFQELFADSGVPNPLRWTNINGRVTPDGTGEPSEPYALNLAGNATAVLDTISSLTANLSGRAGQGVTLGYWQQPQGTGDAPEAADSLVTEALNDLGNWVALRKLPGAAVRPFAFERINLDSAAADGGSFFHSGFKFRFRSRSSTATTTRQDDWFVDDVFLGVPNTIPQMVVAPQSIADTVLVGSSDTSRYSFSIRNNNPFATGLNYTIVESPAVSWLATVPTSGSVPGGLTSSVRVTTNFAGVTPGVFTTRLIISGNDPANPIDTVNVNFRVNAAPAIRVTPDSFFYARNRGDSVTAQFRVRNAGLGPLTYNASVSGGFAGDSTTNIGSDQFNLSTSSILLRGGVVGITRTVQLTEIKSRLTISSPVQLAFTVLENTSQTGTFTKIFERVVTSGTGAQFYSSGPMALTLQAGRFYAIGVVWSAGVTYYWSTNIPVPVPTSFGSITGGLAATLTSFPAPSTVTVSTLSSLYYTQIQTASGRWLELTTNPSGSVAPGDSVNVGFKIRTSQLTGGTQVAALTVNNNDPLMPSVNIPVRLDVLTDVSEQNLGIPETYELSQNYPNPFNPTTKIKFALPKESVVQLKIFNLLGQEVATLSDEVRPAGYYIAEWNGMNNAGGKVGSGVYFYRFEAKATSDNESFARLMKMLLLK